MDIIKFSESDNEIEESVVLAALAETAYDQERNREKESEVNLKQG